MAGRGVFFALTPDDESALLNAADDEAVMAVVERIEELWDRAHLQETDKSWSAIQRSFCDGEDGPDGGEYALNICISGSQSFYGGDDYYVGYLSKQEAADVASALADIDEAAFRQRYAILATTDYPKRHLENDDDFQYTWSWMQGVANFYTSVAKEGRAVIFTVDQ